MNKINFEQDKSESIQQTNDVKSLSDQVLKLRNLEDQVKEAEDNLKKLKQEADVISSEVIPTMMIEMNVSTLKLADGSAVEVKPVYGASIPIAKKEEAFTWLRNNGLGDLIKNEVTVAFGRNEDNKASEYADLARGRGYQPTQKLKVEPMTLKALFRERSENNQELPSEHFNLFKGNKTKITRSK